MRLPAAFGRDWSHRRSSELSLKRDPDSAAASGTTPRYAKATNND
jgi:hypothetical protein